MERKILVADDSRTVRRMIGSYLASGGYKVVEAESGSEALGKLAGESFDALITDWNMPDGGGLELIRGARALPTARMIPILVLTTEESRRIMQEGRAAGATGWIVKPIDPLGLLELVGKVLS